MTEKIEAEITYTIDEYARALLFIQRRQFLVRYYFVLIPIMILLVSYFVFTLMGDSPHLMSAATFIFYAITTGIFALGCGIFIFTTRNSPNFFLKANLRRQFDSSPALQAPKIVTFDDEGMAGASDLGGGITKWEAFTEAAETEALFLFFTSNKFAHFVPKRAFTLQQQEQIRNLTKMKMGDKSKMLS